MNQSKTGARAGWSVKGQFGFVLLCLLTILGFLFWDGLKPDHVLFSNDGPLGAISSHSSEFPGVFLGSWSDMNWLGFPVPSATPDVSQLVHLVSGHVIFAKIYAPFALFFLGMSAWLCFRQWKLSPVACIVGALGTCLNSDFFSTACWGVAAQPLSFGCDFLALAALAEQTSPKRWVRLILAGFAVGVGVMEAFDIGAIFSLVVAAYVVYQGLVSEGTVVERVTRSFVRLAVVGGFAIFIAAAAVSTLISTQIKGIAGMGQDAASKAGRWDEATMWSMPKRETLCMIVPGLFGFRMDTPNGGIYWGGCGRHAAWDRFFAGEPLRAGQTLDVAFPGSPNAYSASIADDGKITVPNVGEFNASGKTLAELEQEIAKRAPALAAKGVTVALERPRAALRYGGGGIYVGIVVVLIALWAVFQAFRRQNSVFSLIERKYLWFWIGMGILCALVGLGRFAPFYQFFYALPFASTMRSPSKFYHVVEWILVILFAYGVHGLSQYCRESAAETASGLSVYLQKWWPKAPSADKRWIIGMVAAVGASLLGWLIYASMRDDLVKYLTYMSGLEGHPPDDAAATAQAIASFSIRQVGWYVLFLALGAAVVALFLSGYFSGQRWKLGAILLGVVVTADLGRANLPWVVGWNWVEKYASNPVIDLLRQKPYEHRVTGWPFPSPSQGFSFFSQLYEIEWKQQLFPYNNIQTLDLVMLPRPPLDYIGFETAMSGDGSAKTVHRITRRWTLTNTRYLLGPAAFLGSLNSQLDPEKQRFKYLVRFNIGLKPGLTQYSKPSDITADIAPDGELAVFEFTGALPRAKLYANWQVNTNDQQTLAELASPQFEPEKVVLVANQLPAPAPASATNDNPGTVDFVSYAPKRIVLKTQAAIPTVLLLNDKTDENWHVTVDGKPETLLRCNYLMRGVYLQAGSHTVEFRYQPATGSLYVSLAAVVIALVLMGYLFVTREKPAPEAPMPASNAPKAPGKSKR